jgi:NAD(P)-dependent dehydrogenase (short-subunit alcohol dehydrogenase family)
MVDLGPALEERAVRAALADELLDSDTGLREVGYDGHQRTTADATSWTADATSWTEPGVHRMAASPGPDDLLVVTGGARGVTARCVLALAERFPCQLLILGRTRLTDEPAWAAGHDGARLKGAVLAELRSGPQAAGHPVTPREVERVCHEIIAVREVRRTLDRLAELHARADYRAVDVLDRVAVHRALAGNRGRITGVVHGAGVLADRLITQKTREQIERVLATKLIGLENVLTAVDEDRLRTVVLFSSVAGLTGNPGQADYAVANAGLDRIAVALKRRLPDSRITAIDWGPWDGGMVTPELRELLGSRGLTLLPPETGAGMFTEQFTPDHTGDTVVVIGPAPPPETGGRSGGGRSGSGVSPVAAGAGVPPGAVSTAATAPAGA